MSLQQGHRLRQRSGAEVRNLLHVSIDLTDSFDGAGIGSHQKCDVSRCKPELLEQFDLNSLLLMEHVEPRRSLAADPLPLIVEHIHHLAMLIHF